jgi:hypothetical protein
VRAAALASFFFAAQRGNDDGLVRAPDWLGGRLRSPRMHSGKLEEVQKRLTHRMTAEEKVHPPAASLDPQDCRC